MISSDQCEVVDERFRAQSIREVFELAASHWGIPDQAELEEVVTIMSAR